MTCPLPSAVAALSLAAALAAAAPPTEPPEDPDALYRQRETPELAMRAAEIWEARLAEDPKDFDVACKLARARFYVGEASPRSQRARHFKKGVEAARVAIALEPERPDGQFWLGANLGALAGVSGRLSALRRRSSIREAFEASLARDPDFARGAAYCALGKYYNDVPAFFGGDKQKAEELLRRCLEYDPDSTVGHYYLGQTLLGLGRKTEAVAALRTALDAPVDPDRVAESRLWKERAERLLARVAATEGRRGAGAQGSP